MPDAPVRQAIAVDFGGTQIRVALVDETGELRERYTAPTIERDDASDLVDRLERGIRAVARAAAGEVAGVGIAAPGPLDPWRGFVYNLTNVPNYRNVPLGPMLRDRLGMTVTLGNDGNFAALGEHRYGAGRGVAHMIYLVVGTGVGGGIIVDNRLLLGAGGLAGEVGHMVVELDGPACNCGGYGCLEALASGTGIARRTAERLAMGARSSLAGLGRPPTAADVASAALAGDPLALDVIRQAGRAMGAGIASLLHLLNPTLIVLGGGVTHAGEPFWGPLRREVEERAMPFYLEGLRIVPAGLGDDAGLFGAAAAAFDAA